MSPGAVYHARVVMEVLKDAVTEGEMEGVRSQLPAEYAPSQLSHSPDGAVSCLGPAAAYAPPSVRDLHYPFPPLRMFGPEPRHRRDRLPLHLA
jgi:Uncharacterized conserved protein (DUF2267)